MRHKDPELMKKIRTYIGEFYIEHDRTPSTTEIAKYFGIARSTSQNYLVAMNERGLLSYQGGRLVIDKMDKLRTDRQQAPLVVIRQESDPKEGDLVIALDEENRNTLKKYGGKDRKTRKIILEYCNKAVYGDKKILVKHLVCQGVVSHIIKKR